VGATGIEEEEEEEEEEEDYGIRHRSVRDVACNVILRNLIRFYFYHTCNTYTPVTNSCIHRGFICKVSHTRELPMFVDYMEFSKLCFLVGHVANRSGRAVTNTRDNIIFRLFIYNFADHIGPAV
jgi:hypothetical protein